MSKDLLADAVARVIRATALHPDLHEELGPVALLLCESMVAGYPEGLSPEGPSPEIVSDAHRLAAMLNRLVDRDPGERRGIVQARTGWSRSKYYRELDIARELELLE